jgi:hypothetical protein
MVFSSDIASKRCTRTEGIRDSVTIAILLVILRIVVRCESSCILIVIIRTTSVRIASAIAAVAGWRLTMSDIGLINIVGKSEQPLQAMKPQLKFGCVWTSDFEHLFVAKDEGKNGKWGVFRIFITIFISPDDNYVMDKLKGKRGAAKIIVLPTKMA